MLAFATLCFASGLVSDSGSLTQKTEANSSHHQHQEYSVNSSNFCDLGQDNCVTDNVATVLGHAAMYDAISSMEVVSLSFILLFVLVLLWYCRRLFREVIQYGKFTWFRYRSKESSISPQHNFLSWTAFHTRSPNAFLI